MARHDHIGGKPNHIDVHHHFYPPEFSQAVNDFTGHKLPMVERWTPEASLEEMDTNGVSTAILSLWSIPGVWMGSDVAGMRRWSRLVNDYAADMRRDHPGRFGLFAALPMPDVEGSLIEIEYALDVLKADGVGLMTNYGDTWPGDPIYKPVFEELNRRKAVVYFHPVAPSCCAGQIVLKWTRSSTCPSSLVDSSVCRVGRSDSSPTSIRTTRCSPGRRSEGCCACRLPFSVSIMVPR